MAKRCHFCDKRTISGHSISHAHNVSNRTWIPNLQKVKAFIDGSSRRVWACTRCLRNGKVQKPIVRTWQPEEEAASS
jgi:large subunit ribosomal protein L28